MTTELDEVIEKLARTTGARVSRRDTLTKLWRLSLVSVGLNVTGVLLPVSKAWGACGTTCAGPGNCNCGPNAPDWCGGCGRRCDNNACTGDPSCSWGGCWTVTCSSCGEFGWRCSYRDCCCDDPWDCNYHSPPCRGNCCGAEYCPNGKEYCCTALLGCETGAA